MNSVQKQIIQLVRNTVNTYSSTPIPKIDEICDGLGLEIREDIITDGTDGMIVDKTNIIVINSRIRYEERKRFTAFHEIMHYLIENDDDLISILNEYTLSQEGEYDRQLEIFANIGAAEFLMPSKEFRELYIEKGLSVELIPLAAKKFESSVIAATIQLAHIAPSQCITAICEPPYNDHSTESMFITENGKDRRQKLHVTYAAASSTMKYKLARDTIIPIGHLMYESFLKDRPVTGESCIPFRSGKNMPCYCEALADGDRVFVIFHLSPPPTPQSEKQMNLFSQS